jgi:uncharacterized protein (TIGR00369 family)
VTTDSVNNQPAPVSKSEHRRCFVCGSENPQGLRLEFAALSDGSVSAVFPCHSVLQGYDGLLHGGIISCLLDGAMTNCLFSKGIIATTGHLEVRFLHPVVIDTPARVIARVTRSRPPLHFVEAELLQGGTLLVRATGKFMETS